jgi:hypothetical protein
MQLKPAMLKTLAPPLAVGMLACMLASCTNGPALIVGSHVEYNQAVRRVMNEELLLNIVRMRYAESPQFVEVTGITTTFETGGTVGGTGANLNTSGITAGASGSITFTDRPTITLTPRQGRETASQLLGSIDVADIPYLASAGYRLDHLLVLLAENINGVRSFDVGSVLPTRGGQKEFSDVIKAIAVLQRRDEIICGFLKAYDFYDGTFTQSQLRPTDYLAAVQSGKRWRPIDGQSDAWALHTYDLEPVIWISPNGLASEEGKTIVRLLHLDPTADFYWLGDLKFQTAPTEPTDSIRIRMRSFYGVMNFLAHAVQIPPKDEASGRSLMQPPGEGELAKHVMLYLSKILHIHESSKPPKDAFVAVRHRGNWFYIDDREVMSKRSFSMAIELMNLEISGESNGPTAPILTIPVG